MPHPARLAVLAVAASLAALAPARAGELYAPLGVPGVGIGWAQPIGAHFGLRVDHMALGERSERRTEDGIRYDARIQARRTALLADWFPFAGGFRLTTGLTANQYRIDLAANGSGGTLTIGSNTYTTTAADRFDVLVKFPSTTPYLGMGWGHGHGSGLRFSFDVGAKLGKATVSYQLSGPLAARVTQADIDAEMTELRDGVGKVRLIPQLSFGLGYSF